MTIDVVIIGAGLAGLTAAYRLKNAGYEVVVLEARDRVGGRTFNYTLPDGTISEMGGQWIGSTHKAILALAHELNIQIFATYNEGYHLLFSNDKCYRGKECDFLSREIEDAQTQLEELSQGISLECPWKTKAAKWLDSQSIAQWMNTHIQDVEVRYSLYKSIESLFCFDPNHISLLHVCFFLKANGSFNYLNNIENSAQQFRFVGGSQEVSIRLAHILRGSVQLASPVRSVIQTDKNVTVGHDKGSIETKWAIVATPLQLAAEITYAPSLPRERFCMMQKSPMGHVIKCAVVYKKPFWRDDNLSGKIDSLHSPVVYTYDNSPPSGHIGILAAFIDSKWVSQVKKLDLSRRRQLVIDCLVAYLGEQARSPVDYFEVDWAAEEWSGGGFSVSLAPHILSKYSVDLRTSYGRIYWAGAETSAKSYGYMDGAVRSGERVAQELLELLAEH